MTQKIFSRLILLNLLLTMALISIPARADSKEEAKKKEAALSPEKVERISPQDAYALVSSGKVLLVCAYDNEEKFKANHLEGAISLSEFKALLPKLKSDQAIIFYCG